MDRFNKSCVLVCAAFTLGGLTLLAAIVSISTSNWLYVTEKLSLQYFSTYDTIEYEEIEESMDNTSLPDSFEISVVMGLWRFCSVAMGLLFYYSIIVYICLRPITSNPCELFMYIHRCFGLILILIPFFSSFF